MVDVEDIVEAVVDIEDIVEELADPEDLLEDLLEDPALVLLALAAAAAALVTALLVLVTLVFLLFALGPVVVVASLAFMGLSLTLLALAGFLYFRTNIPADVRRKIRAARDRSDDTAHPGASMSEQEAIDRLKTRYAAGELTELELERALEDVLTSEDPGRVVERVAEPSR